MIPLHIKVESYDKNTNYCLARLIDGQMVAFDPFVACAIKQSDEEYESGAGGKIVGNKYVLTDFSVQEWDRDGVDYQVCPNEGGMTAL